MIPGQAALSVNLPGVLRHFGPGAAVRLLSAARVRRGEKVYSLTGFVETKSLFVHIPKAAGFSVAQALYGNLGYGHRPISVYQDIFRDDALQKIFTFTFVRNPWDRVYSAYRFLKAGGWPEYDADYAETYLKDCDSFEQFVLEILPRPEARQKLHFRSSLHYLRDRDGGMYPFDYVGRYETFREDFEKVRKYVNPQARLTHLNKTRVTRKQGYRDVYTNEMIDIVGSLYGESIRELGYSFDGFSNTMPGLARRATARQRSGQRMM